MLSIRKASDAMTNVVELFTGADAVRAVSGALVLIVWGGAGWWVRHRRNERRHEETDRSLDQRDVELTMIQRAVFQDRAAVAALALLLSKPHHCRTGTSHVVADTIGLLHRANSPTRRTFGYPKIPAACPGTISPTPDQNHSGEAH